MSRLVPSALALALAALLGGCASAYEPVNGIWYSDVQGPLQATHGAKALKEGTSKCESFLGVVALGDASIETAMKNGGITRLHHVDHHTRSILGVYAEFTTVVWGDDGAVEGAGGAGGSESEKKTDSEKKADSEKRMDSEKRSDSGR